MQIELEKKLTAIPTNTPAVKALHEAQVELAQLNVKFLQLNPAERQIQGQAIEKKAKDLMTNIKILDNSAEGYTPPEIAFENATNASETEASK